jgi:hypothetical protein
MYDDLLGKRKPKEIGGVCHKCIYANKTKDPQRHFTYCAVIKKHVHKYQYGCLKFVRRIIVEDAFHDEEGSTNIKD